MNRHRALAYCLRMIFSENRFPLFRIMLYWLAKTGATAHAAALSSFSAESVSTLPLHSAANVGEDHMRSEPHVFTSSFKDTQAVSQKGKTRIVSML